MFARSFARVVTFKRETYIFVYSFRGISEINVMLRAIITRSGVEGNERNGRLPLRWKKGEEKITKDFA